MNETVEEPVAGNPHGGFCEELTPVIHLLYVIIGVILLDNSNAELSLTMREVNR
jgi:hypothetical protein